MTQLATTDVRHILSLFNTVSCNRYALVPVFLQSTCICTSISANYRFHCRTLLLFLVFQRCE